MNDESGKDRRQSPRYATATCAAMAGWHGSHGFKMVRGRLQNISMGGFALIVDTGFPETPSIWVKLADAEPAEWSQAAVVGMNDLKDGRTRLRLQFPDGCPYDLFRAAVVGSCAPGEEPAPLPREIAATVSSPPRAAPEQPVAVDPNRGSQPVEAGPPMTPLSAVPLGAAFSRLRRFGLATK